jgi:hypothetical protein
VLGRVLPMRVDQDIDVRHLHRLVLSKTLDVVSVVK